MVDRAQAIKEARELRKEYGLDDPEQAAAGNQQADVQQIQAFDLNPADKLTLYGKIFNVDGNPATLDAGNSHYQALRAGYNELRGVQLGLLDAIGAQYGEQANAQQILALANGQLQSAVSMVMVYNDSLRPDQQPVTLAQVLDPEKGAALQEQMAAQLLETTGSQEALAERMVPYRVLAGVAISDTTADLITEMQPETKIEPSIFAKIEAGEKVGMFGARTYEQIKSDAGEYAVKTLRQSVETQEIAGLKTDDFVKVSALALGMTLPEGNGNPAQDRAFVQEVGNAYGNLVERLAGDFVRDNEDVLKEQYQKLESVEGVTFEDYARSAGRSFVSGEILTQSLAIRMAYNANNETPLTVENSGSDVRKTMIEHFNTLPEAERAQYFALSQVILGNAENVLVQAGTYAQTGGNLDISGAKDINQAKVVVAYAMTQAAAAQAEANEALVKQAAETFSYYGRNYGIEYAGATPTQQETEQTLDLFNEKLRGFADQLQASEPRDQWIAELRKVDEYKDVTDAQAEQAYDAYVAERAVQEMQDELASLVIYHAGVQGNIPTDPSVRFEAVEDQAKRIEVGREYLEALGVKAEKSPESAEAQLLTATYQRIGQVINQVAAVNASVQQNAPEVKQPESGATQTPQYRVEMVPDPERNISAESMQDIEKVRQIASNAITVINSQQVLLSQLGREEKLPEMPAQKEGVVGLDKESYAVFNELYQILATKAGIENADSYTPEGGAKLNSAVDSMKTSFNPLDMGTAAIIDGAVFPDSSRQQLIAALDRLSAADALRPVEMVEKRIPITQDTVLTAGQTSGANVDAADAASPTVKPETVTQPETGANKGDGKEPTVSEEEAARKQALIKQGQIVSAATTVEGFLVLGQGMIGDIPGAQMLEGLGDIKEDILPTITAEDAADGKFSDASRDVTSKMIFAMKMAAGGTQAGFANVDGTYSPAIGAQLKLHVLANPNMAFVRSQMVDPKTNEPLLPICMDKDPTTGQALTDAQRRALIKEMESYNGKDNKDLDALKASGKLDDREYEGRKAVRQEIDAKYKDNLEGVKQVNNLITSLNVLHQNNELLDDKDARGVNQYNIMLDVASAALDKYFPGLKTMIKDFFENTGLGEMAGSLLGYKGIDIARLWGEGGKRDLADPKQLVEDMKKDFDKVYDEAEAKLKADNKPTDAKSVLEEAKNMANEAMNSGLSGVAFRSTMKMIFEDRDESFIKDAINNAYDNAIAGVEKGTVTNRTEARGTFTLGISAVMDSKDIVPESGSKMREDAQELAVEHGAQVPAPAPKESVPADDAANTTVPLEERRPANPDVDGTSNCVDDRYIMIGDQKVSLNYQADTQDYNQHPLRLSNGRLGTLQDILKRNADGLELTQQNFDQMKEDQADKYTSSVLEEVLIRAKLEEFAADGEISDAELDSFKQDLKEKTLGKLLSENIDAIDTFMASKRSVDFNGDGTKEETSRMSAGDREKFKAVMEDLAKDMESVKPGETVKPIVPVLEQSFTSGQFTFDLTQAAAARTAQMVEPKPGETPEDIYLRANKGYECEVPIFYMKEGSNSVFAAIRDKAGVLDHPDGKEIQEIEFDLYKNTNKIQGLLDKKELDALTHKDNYVWRHPDREGVRNVINEVLDLGPSKETLDANAGAMHKQEEPVVSQKATMAEEPAPGKVPECFLDFPSINKGSADFHFRAEIADLLDLDSNRTLADMAQRDVRDQLEVLFDQKAGELHKAGASKQTGVIFMDLEKAGIKHPTADVVMGIRGPGGNWDLRYVDYDKHFVRPLSEQGMGKDLCEIVDPRTTDPRATGGNPAPRRLDHLMIYYNRGQHERTHIMHKDGYASMAAIERGNRGFFTKNGFDSIYKTPGMDNSTYQQATMAYQWHMANNYNINTAYMQDIRNFGQMQPYTYKRLEIAERDSQKCVWERGYNQNRRNGGQYQNSRSEEFNDKSGVQEKEPWYKGIPIVEKAVGNLVNSGGGQKWAWYKWRNGGPNMTLEQYEKLRGNQEPESEAAQRIEQNMRDCNICRQTEEQAAIEAPRAAELQRNQDMTDPMMGGGH